MVMSLYPATQQNKKLADVAVKMLDAGILADSLTEQEVDSRLDLVDWCRYLVGSLPHAD